MSSSKTQSVLYILDPARPRIDDIALYYAQQTAVVSELPIAVVVCVPTKDDLPSLLVIERLLARYSIPLLTLIGQAEPRIAATAYHLKPKKIFYQQNEKSSYPLANHAITWPGAIASVQQLIDTDGQAC